MSETDEIAEIKNKLDSEVLPYESLKSWIHSTRSAKVGLYNQYLAVQKADEQLIQLCRAYRSLQKLAKSKIKKLYPCRKVK